MKNFIGFMLVSLMGSAPALALECPKYTLSCQLQKVNSGGGNYIAAQTTSEFIEINDDEPSLPPNECQATAVFSADLTGTGLSLHTVVKDSLRAYQYAFKDFGAYGPQLEVETVPGKTFALYFDKTSMICQLK